MTKRKIIKIDEAKCNGCGECIPNCPEGAIQIIDGKARLISDLFCDGLGACIGYCPRGAIKIEEREAEEYSEKKVMENIIKQGKNVIKAHLEHLKSHGQDKYLREALDFLKQKNIEVPPGIESKHAHTYAGCPGMKIMDFRQAGDKEKAGEAVSIHKSELRQWPIQISLLPSDAPYFDQADILIAADCVPFAYADFHQDILKGKILLVGCPKLDDIGSYQDKLTQIFKNNFVKSVTYAHMQVPCCFGLVGVVQSAITESKKKIPFKEIIISIKGERLK